MTFYRKKTAPKCTKEVGGTKIVTMQIRMGFIMVEGTILDLNMLTVSIGNLFEDTGIH